MKADRGAGGTIPPAFNHHAHFPAWALVSCCAIGAMLLLFALTGCRTVIGHVPTPLGDVSRSEIDCIRGRITNFKKDGTKTYQSFNTELVVEANWQTGAVIGKPRFFSWDPLGGATLTRGKVSWFAGTKYLSIGSFGLHFGVDGDNLFPFGMNWKKKGVVFGPQVGIPYKSVLMGDATDIVPSILAAFQF